MEYLYCPALPLLSFLVPSCGRGVPSRGLDNVLAGCRRCQTRGVCGATAGMLRRRLGPPSPSEPPCADAVQPHPPYTPSVFFSPLCPPSSPPTHPPTTPPQVLVWGASAALFYQDRHAVVPWGGVWGVVGVVVGQEGTSRGAAAAVGLRRGGGMERDRERRSDGGVVARPPLPPRLCWQRQSGGHRRKPTASVRGELWGRGRRTLFFLLPPGGGREDGCRRYERARGKEAPRHRRPAAPVHCVSM